LAAAVAVALLAVGVAAFALLKQPPPPDDRPLKEAMREADQRQAHVALALGRALCEQGHRKHGLLWLARALELADRAGDNDLQRVARVNLAGWERAPLTAVRTETERTVLAALSPDGRLLALATPGPDDHPVEVWDLREGKPHLVQPDKPHAARPLPHPQPVAALAFSPDGTALVTGGDDRVVRFWDMSTGERQAEYSLPEWGAGQPDGVSAVALSPGKRYLLAGTRRGAVALWEIGKGKEPVVLAAPDGPPGAAAHKGATVGAVAFSPDGKTFLTGAADSTARLWTTATRKPLGEALVHAGPVTAAAFSPDGKTVLTGGSESKTEGTARLWDAVTGRPVGAPMVEGQPLVRVLFSTDGGTLLLAGKASARLWDAATCKPLGAPLVTPGPCTAVAFAPDGRQVWTVGANPDALHSWPIPGPIEGTVSRVVLWAQNKTGMELTPEGNALPLSPSAREKYRLLPKERPSDSP
jgi:WD40 repeat protein